MQRGRRHPKSKKSKYYISEFRYCELVYFCLQYDEWRRDVLTYEHKGNQDEWSDPTAEDAIKHALCKEKIALVNRIAKKAAGDDANYILKAVTEDRSYNNLSTYCGMNIGRDRYFKMREKFFYFLSQEKQGVL